MKQKGVLLVAVIFAILAFVLIQMWADRVKKQTILEQGEMVTILAAKTNIPPNTPISDDMLSTMEVPKKWRNPNALQPKDKEFIIGTTNAVPLEAGQQILWSDLSKNKELLQESLASIIKEGERAITMPVDELTGIAGLLRPNDHVDIIGTFNIPGELKNDASSDSASDSGTPPENGVKFNKMSTPKEKYIYTMSTTTITLLQNVTILATGATIGTGTTVYAGPEATDESFLGKKTSERGPYNSVTLLVTPMEAEIIVYALSQGQLTLSLRNPEDLKTKENFPKIVFTDIVKPDLREQVRKERDVMQVKKKQETLPTIINIKGGQ
jgi:pilus assembly protein CpaB